MVVGGSEEVLGRHPQKVQVVGHWKLMRVRTAEIISADPERFPVPDCARTTHPLPWGTAGAAGGTLFNGNIRPEYVISVFI